MLLLNIIICEQYQAQSVIRSVEQRGVGVWWTDRYDNEYGYSTRVTDLIKYINVRDHA